MKRRNFIKLTSTASASALLPFELFKLVGKLNLNLCPDTSVRKVVLVQLAGGNDGLNTLVPLSQYDLYANLRPNLKLNLSGQNKVIPLDTTLSTENQYGLHPVMSEFKNLYDSGYLKIIQGVGYPNVNKSHFKSTDLWLTGGDGYFDNFSMQSGWLGRFMENYYSQDTERNYPLGLQIGSPNKSLLFHGENNDNLSLNLNTKDENNYYSVIHGLGGTPPLLDNNTEYFDKVNHIISIDNATNTYSESISSAFNNGTNAITYPDTDLANQLKTVARFIEGGLKTNFYLVTLYGFDTHDNQIPSVNQAHLGNHATLLQVLSDAMSAFMNDLNALGIGEDVLALTFSEFGRKVKENANLGTDHGDIAPMFVFGKSIIPGIIGSAPDLSLATEDNNYQIQHLLYDYRSVFSTLLQDWLGANNQTLNESLYDHRLMSNFANTKINDLLKANRIVPPNCYNETPLNSGIKTVAYPNPFINSLSILSDTEINSIIIYTMDGKQVLAVQSGLKSTTLYLDFLTPSTYILYLELKDGSKQSHKIIKL